MPANSGMKLHDMVQAIVTVLAVINPVVCGSIFLTLTPELAPAQKRAAAVKVALGILIILVASALIGLRVLSIFGISLDVFRIVGGMIVAYMGFDMLRGRQTVAQASPTDDDAAASNSLCAAHHVRRRFRDHHGGGYIGGRRRVCRQRPPSTHPQSADAWSCSTGLARCRRARLCRLSITRGR